MTKSEDSANKPSASSEMKESPTTLDPTDISTLSHGDLVDLMLLPQLKARRRTKLRKQRQEKGQGEPSSLHTFSDDLLLSLYENFPLFTPELMERNAKLLQSTLQSTSSNGGGKSRPQSSRNARTTEPYNMAMRPSRKGDSDIIERLKDLSLEESSNEKKQQLGKVLSSTDAEAGESPHTAVTGDETIQFAHSTEAAVASEAEAAHLAPSQVSCSYVSALQAEYVPSYNDLYSDETNPVLGPASWDSSLPDMDPYLHPPLLPVSPISPTFTSSQAVEDNGLEALSMFGTYATEIPYIAPLEFDYTQARDSSSAPEPTERTRQSRYTPYSTAHRAQAPSRTRGKKRRLSQAVINKWIAADYEAFKLRVAKEEADRMPQNCPQPFASGSKGEPEVIRHDLVKSQPSAGLLILPPYYETRPSHPPTLIESEPGPTAAYSPASVNFDSDVIGMSSSAWWQQVQDVTASPLSFHYDPALDNYAMDTSDDVWY